MTVATGEAVDIHSPSRVELHMCIKQSDDGSGGCSPAADSGPDQSLLLVVADHLDEAWAVLGVGLIHEALQVLLQLHWTQRNTQTQRDVTLSEARCWVDQIDAALQKLHQLHSTQEMSSDCLSFLCKFANSF